MKFILIKLFSFLFTGSQHSGTAEEDLNTSNDLDFSSKQDQDRDQDSDDEEGIDCRCFVCERQCHDIDQWVF